MKMDSSLAFNATNVSAHSMGWNNMLGRRDTFNPM
jgi:hypothetical protein